MRVPKILILCALFALLLGPATPGQASLPAQEDNPQAIDAIPVLACAGTGTGGDLADLRGIRFTVDQAFQFVEVRLAGSVAGNYVITAELRRSSGFVTTPIATDTISVNLPETGSVPFHPVQFDFGNITVTGDETFTVKMLNVDSAGTPYLETFGIGNTPCPNVQETDENNVADPTERGDPAGFKALAPNPNTLTITSSYAAIPPNIDGKISSGEWDLSNTLPFDNGFITFRNDGLRLYILIDVLYDLHADDVRGGDYFWLSFDVNENAAIDPNVDLMYNTTVSEHNMRYQYYLGPGSWTGLQPETRSARARGFGCFFADGTFSLTSIFPLRFECTRHRLWEFGIDLDEISATAGSTLKMGFRVASATPSFINNTPPSFSTDFSNLISVVTAPVLFIAPDPDYTISLDTDAIEVTQAIQDRDNTLPLVQDKSTVARVYVDVNNAVLPQGVTALLYGSRDGVDLPGSPLMLYYSAPTSINRSVLNHTANFAIPTTWDSGDVSFYAKARSLHNQEVTSTPFEIAFNLRDVPTYWYIPINTGTNEAPVLISTATMNAQRSYLEAVYPVARVNWVQKPWTVIGPTTVGNTIAELNDYYNSAALAWILSIIFTGNAPFDLPDQIYGFVPSGGGISDPTWIGANGRVGRGFLGTSLEGTAAHEINHNLDRSANGTWGRHVPGGCGAGGPDPAWPYANDDIQEVGFDTRLPWVDTAVQDSVIPSNFPDFMSYCQSGKLPTKWISPYRWTNIFNTLMPPASNLAAQAAAEAQEVYYISGMIQDDGTGSLNPAFIQMGEPSLPAQPANAEIQLRGAKDELLGSMPFNVDFLEDPEEPFTVTYFNLRVPVPTSASVAKNVMVYNDGTLDEIVISSNTPTVTVNPPTLAGQTLPAEGLQTVGALLTISWTASDEDGDALSFTLLYSPDSGKNWFPIASNISGSSYEVDTSTLPCGAGGIFRVIVTDGANTSEDDSDAAVALPNNPPSVLIAGEQTVLPDAPVVLTGQAFDTEDGPITDEESFVWTEGETVLGTGSVLEAMLSYGYHDITLSVTDSQDNTTQVVYRVLVGHVVYMPIVIR